jgi:hypothetical protein
MEIGLLHCQGMFERDKAHGMWVWKADLFLGSLYAYFVKLKSHSSCNCINEKMHQER